MTKIIKNFEIVHLLIENLIHTQTMLGYKPNF
jgi:hypothetical protein